MKVLIAGGGTGGHVFPGVALAQELVRRDSGTEVVFVGTPRGMETTAVPKAGFRLELLDVRPLRGRTLREWFRNIGRLPLALRDALKLVKTVNPDVAVSVGGYAAGPAVLACWMLGVPCVVMEQNALPGWTNRLLGLCAKKVLASVPAQGFQASKTKVLGNPVRVDILSVREQPYRVHEPLRLLVMGGSQGARALNTVMMELAAKPHALEHPWRVVHQTGATDAEQVRLTYARLGVENIEAKPFIDSMSEAYAQADLVLCRAGASTLAELTLCGRPSVLVPFPHAAGDHQTHNALWMENQGAAVHMPQSALSLESLVACLNRFGADHGFLQAMAAKAYALGKPEALQDTADVVTALAEGEGV